MKRNLLAVSFIFFTFLGFGQTADFSYTASPVNYCNPTSIRFTQLCTGSPIAMIWNFGNNTTSSDFNPTVNFTNAGTYNVKLTAIYESTSIDITKTITVNAAAQISLAVDRNYICQPGIINFTAVNNGNIAAFEWDFGDGGNKVTSTTNTISHNYAAMGNYRITLTATNAAGCSDSAVSGVEVKPLVMNATVTPADGCIPTVANFRATTTIPANSSITGYAWNFGDASPIRNTTTPNVSHSYTTTGRFMPVLTVTTSEGCSNSFTLPEIGFGTRPARPNAYPVKPVVCGSEYPQMVAKSPTATSYLWDYGDGGTAIAVDTVVRHHYTSIGRKTIIVTPSFNGCLGTPDTFQLNVIGVIANFRFANTCTDKKDYTFTNISQGNISSYAWNFGDDSPEDSQRNTSHRFPETGTFFVKLSLEDNTTGCEDTIRKVIYTANPLLSNPDTVLCKNVVTNFLISNGYANPDAIYTWNVMGDSIRAGAEQSMSIKADSLGYFRNFVVIDNGSGNCPDTVGINNTMLVKGPSLSFDAVSAICLNSSFAVTNNSAPFLPGDAINAWQWNFGELSTNDNVYQPAPYQYKRSGWFNVRLMATDNNGCSDTLKKVLRVNATPILRAMPRVDTLCSGQPSTLVAIHNGTLTWEQPNLVSCDSCDSVTVNPTNTTWLYLNAINASNCISRDSILVRVFNPFNAGANPEDAYVCQNESTVLNIVPVDKKISWSPATGLSNAAIYSPVAKPNQTTIYTATLSDSAGCFKDSVQVTVHVKSLPTVNAGPDQFVAYSNAYTLSPMYSSNVRNYSWTMDNGLNCNNCATPTGMADKSKTHKITVVSDSGCVASDLVNIYIQCSDAYLLMPVAFTPNSDGHNDFYYPLTRGIKIVKHFAVYNRQGQLVFQAQNFLPNSQTAGWDGYYKGNPQMAGTFIYTMEAQCDAGETLNKKGTFVLMR